MTTCLQRSQSGDLRQPRRRHRSPSSLPTASNEHGRRRLVTAGVLVAVHQGVVSGRDVAGHVRVTCVAACLADPTAVITGLAAAPTCGTSATSVGRDRPVVLVAHDRTPIARDVLLRRTNTPRPHDVVAATGRHPGRQSAASVVRLRPRPRRRAFRAAHRMGARSPRLGADAVARDRELTQRGRPGAGTSEPSDEPAIRLAAAGRFRARTPRARGTRAARRRPARPPVSAPAAEPARSSIPDGADPEAKWAVEVDHVTWHGGRFDAQRDKGRDRNARRIGWQVDRVTDQELDDGFRAGDRRTGRTLAPAAALSRTRRGVIAPTAPAKA